jgi:hypothetical protein
MIWLRLWYLSIFSTYSFCNDEGTGTILSLTSKVSFTPFEKRPRMFLHTRPVTIVWESSAGALGVAEAEARIQESMPWPTRGVSYSEKSYAYTV